MLSVEDLKRQIKDVNHSMRNLQLKKDALNLKLCEHKNAQWLVLLQNTVNELSTLEDSTLVCDSITRYMYDLEYFTHEAKPDRVVKKLKESLVKTENFQVWKVINELCNNITSHNRSTTS